MTPCPYHSYRYDLLEPALLESLLELDWTALIKGSQPSKQKAIHSLTSRAKNIRKALKDAKAAEANLIEALSFGGGDSAAVVRAVKKAEIETAKIEASLAEVVKALEAAKQQAKVATATSTELTTFTQLLATLVDPELLRATRKRVHGLLGQLISELYLAVWPKRYEEHQAAILKRFPQIPQDLFDTCGKGKGIGNGNGKVFIIRYRLNDDVLQLKARVVIINTTTGQSVTITETIPKPTKSKPQMFSTEDPEVPLEWLKPELHRLPWQQQVRYLDDDQQDAVWFPVEVGTGSFYRSLEPNHHLTLEG
jgi:hypothetical protein